MKKHTSEHIHNGFILTMRALCTRDSIPMEVKHCRHGYMMHVGERRVTVRYKHDPFNRKTLSRIGLRCTNGSYDFV